MPEEVITEPIADDAAASEELNLDALPDGDTFERTYVEQIRAEAAARRVEAKEAKAAAARFEALNDVNDADLNVLSQILQHINSDDPEMQKLGAQAFLAIGNDLLGAPADDPKETPVPESTPAADGALTPEKVQELITAALTAEREAQNQTKAESDRQAAFDTKVEAAGFRKGTPEYYAAVQATVENKGDVDKAIAAAQAFRQSIIDEFVEGRQNDKGIPAPTAGAGGKAPEPPKTMEEASAALRKMVAEANAQP